MYCPKCGANVDDQAKFCPVCGEKLEREQSEFNSNYSDRNRYYRPPVVYRNIPLYIILSTLTCSLFSIYWMYCIITDVNNACSEPEDTSAGMVLILSFVTCGIYFIYWLYKAGEKLSKVSYSRQMQGSNLGILFIILWIMSYLITIVLSFLSPFWGSYLGALFYYITYAVIQNELNKISKMSNF